MRATVKIALLLLGQLAVLGCSTSYRVVTAEHWHDEDIFLVAYTEVTRHSYVVASSAESSAHVLICRVASDNSVTCRQQPIIDRLLGSDPPAAESSPPRPLPVAPKRPAPAMSPPPGFPPEAGAAKPAEEPGRAGSPDSSPATEPVPAGAGAPSPPAPSGTAAPPPAPPDQPPQ